MKSYSLNLSFEIDFILQIPSVIYKINTQNVIGLGKWFEKLGRNSD